MVPAPVSQHGFDAFHRVDDLLVQIIVGNRVGEFDAPSYGRELYAHAPGEHIRYERAGFLYGSVRMAGATLHRDPG